LRPFRAEAATPRDDSPRRQQPIAWRRSVGSNRPDLAVAPSRRQRPLIVQADCSRSLHWSRLAKPAPCQPHHRCVVRRDHSRPRGVADRGAARGHRVKCRRGSRRGSARFVLLRPATSWSQWCYKVCATISGAHTIAASKQKARDSATMRGLELAVGGDRDAGPAFGGISDAVSRSTIWSLTLIKTSSLI
jgi:hypothetical protein